MAAKCPRILSVVLEDNPHAIWNDECDCAPTYEQPIASLFLDTHKLWRKASGLQTIPIIKSWQGVFIPDGFSSLVVLNHTARRLWSRFELQQQLDGMALDECETRVVQQMISAGLLVSPGSATIQSKQEGSQLSAWIHVTDRCNLRCAYCYLPHIREDLSFETGCAAIDATFRSAVEHEYRQVKLKYAGGEPLLCFPRIVKIHSYGRDLANHHALELDGVVLSNGTLLTATMVKQMLALDLHLMLSLDGLAEWHDAQRPYAGGRGSFQDVAEAVELALSYGLTPHISLTVTGRNIDGLPQIVLWLLDYKVPFSINFYRQNSFSALHTDLRLEEEKIIAGMLSAFQAIETNLPRYSLLPMLVDRANLAVPHDRTCSVGQDYLVFNQNGKVAKCHMKMNQTLADVHTTDPLMQIRLDQIGIQNVSVDEKEECRGCEWRYWCTGGCPLETFRATGRFDVKSPNCNIYNAIFPEVLRLEGLRLLKYQNSPT